ncbi:hypothetical protein [Streptomyces sp. SP18CS02]|uniref:hypothetical protein n=1 Tax=Streptomyces sp. SP18CS02 TaxID=3002531 RepID=UPI002E75FFF4|nr:hypothetical protein [Streptomyces sp. SP18CS02]MEE1752804.1 hypothetical protein [Streptomyces sp. SP18CS02]
MRRTDLGQRGIDLLAPVWHLLGLTRQGAARRNATGPVGAACQRGFAGASRFFSWSGHGQ